MSAQELYDRVRGNWRVGPRECVTPSLLSGSLMALLTASMSGFLQDRMRFQGLGLDAVSLSSILLTTSCVSVTRGRSLRI